MLNMNLLDTRIKAPVSRTVQNLDCGLWTGLWNLDLIFGPEFQLPGVESLPVCGGVMQQTRSGKAFWITASILKTRTVAPIPLKYINMLLLLCYLILSFSLQELTLQDVPLLLLAFYEKATLSRACALPSKQLLPDVWTVHPHKQFSYSITRLKALMMKWDVGIADQSNKVGMIA